MLQRVRRWFMRNTAVPALEGSTPDVRRYDDGPIEEVGHDLYGFDPFAKTVADSIRNLRSPHGSVVALNGPWGSGKSSTVNLIRRHLTDLVEDRSLTIIPFSSWWFRGEDALALAFFRELYAGVGPSLGKRARKKLKTLGARLLRAGGGAPGVVGGVLKGLGELIKVDEGVEKLHAELSKILAAKNQRFLVIIDDIDRLASDEALLMFRLVKSAGRLPNVAYLLVFDRLLAERIVAEKFKAEGASYLEKIVQISFELPPPASSDLGSQLLNNIQTLTGGVDDSRAVDFFNVFYDAVAPELRTPRDVVRLYNAFAHTWPAVQGNVDLGDFLALETLRLNRPALYHALRKHKAELCGAERDWNGRPEQRGAELEVTFFSGFSGEEKNHYRTVLLRLFPRLEAVWGNTFHQDGGRWARDRRVCSEQYFDTYFNLYPAGTALLRGEIDALIRDAGEPERLEAALRTALVTPRKDGSTKASLVLEELKLRAADIAQEHIPSLVRTIFRMADELDVPADTPQGGFSFGNKMRIHWLMRRLVLSRYSLDDRTALFLDASREASICWLCDFAESAYTDHHPREGRDAPAEADWLVTAEAADTLIGLMLTRIREAADSGQLLGVRELGSVLYAWKRAADEAEVRAWTGPQLDSDAGVLALVRALTSYSWSHGIGFNGLGDRVSVRNVLVNPESMGRVVDAVLFRRRAQEVQGRLAAAEAKEVHDFLEAWMHRENRPGDW
jgi:predicted KAP-like P-loop ATPase